MRTRLAWCFLILCAAWYTYDTILTQFPDNTGSDFQGYYSGGAARLHGRVSISGGQATFTRRSWPC
jgi:hypothetical protein